MAPAPDYTLRFTSPPLSVDSDLSDTTTLVDEDVQAYDYTKKDSWLLCDNATQSSTADISPHRISVPSSPPPLILRNGSQSSLSSSQWDIEAFSPITPLISGLPGEAENFTLQLHQDEQICGQVEIEFGTNNRSPLMTADREYRIPHQPSMPLNTDPSAQLDTPTARLFNNWGWNASQAQPTNPALAASSFNPLSYGSNNIVDNANEQIVRWQSTMLPGAQQHGLQQLPDRQHISPWPRFGTSSMHNSSDPSASQILLQPTSVLPEANGPHDVYMGSVRPYFQSPFPLHPGNENLAPFGDDGSSAQYHNAAWTSSGPSGLVNAASMTSPWAEPSTNYAPTSSSRLGNHGAPHASMDPGNNNNLVSTRTNDRVDTVTMEEVCPRDAGSMSSSPSSDAHHHTFIVSRPSTPPPPQNHHYRHDPALGSVYNWGNARPSRDFRIPSPSVSPKSVPASSTPISSAAVTGPIRTHRGRAKGQSRTRGIKQQRMNGAHPSGMTGQPNRSSVSPSSCSSAPAAQGPRSSSNSISSVRSRYSGSMPALRPTDAFDTDEAKWTAVVKHDKRADGYFLWAHKKTQVYCRPDCDRNRPSSPRDVIFFPQPDAIEAADGAGFQRCGKCRPHDEDKTKARPGSRTVLGTLYRDCKANPTGESIAFAQHAVSIGLSHFHFARAFDRYLGINPGAFRVATCALVVQDALGRDTTTSEEEVDRIKSNWKERRCERNLGEIKIDDYISGNGGNLTADDGKKKRGVSRRRGLVLLSLKDTDYGDVAVAYTAGPQGEREMKLPQPDANRHCCGLLLGPDAERRLRTRFPHAVVASSSGTAAQQLKAKIASLSKKATEEPWLSDELVNALRRARVYIAVKSILNPRPARRSKGKKDDEEDDDDAFDDGDDPMSDDEDVKGSKHSSENLSEEDRNFANGSGSGRSSNTVVKSQSPVSFRSRNGSGWVSTLDGA